MSNPIKHHYIPQSILNRFCGADGQLYTFNKRIGKRGKRRHPAGVCYEEHLHTIIHAHEKFTEIELFFSQVEGEFLNLLRMVDDLIKSSTDFESLKENSDVFKTLSLFIMLSFWRIPKRSGLAKTARRSLRRIYDRAPNENKELINFDRKLIRDIERKNASASIKITQFLALPSLLSDANNAAIKKCWFYSTEFDQAISDDPIVCDLDENFMLAGEIYIPVGSRLCITNAPSKIAQLQERMLNNAVEIVMASSEECFSFFHQNG